MRVSQQDYHSGRAVVEPFLCALQQNENSWHGRKAALGRTREKKSCRLQLWLKSGFPGKPGQLPGERQAWILDSCSQLSPSGASSTGLLCTPAASKVNAQVLGSSWLTACYGGPDPSPWSLGHAGSGKRQDPQVAGPQPLSEM
jgi:hypothetical protein